MARKAYDGGRSKASGIEFHIFQRQETDFRYEAGMNLFFGLGGTSTIYVGNESCELEREGILTVNPFSLYRAECLEGSLLLLYIPDSILDLAGKRQARNYACYVRDGAGIQPVFGRIRELCAQILYEYLQNKKEVSLASGDPLMELLRYLAEHSVQNYSFGKQPSRSADLRGMRAGAGEKAVSFLRYIEDHWDEDLTLTTLAEEVHFSVSYLSKFFQRALGMNFSAYLRKARMIHARRMLLGGDASVTQIAYDCGFNNTSVFIEAFRQEYNMTPGRFRQLEMEKEAARPLDPADGSQAHDQRSDFSVLLSHMPELVEEQVSVREEVCEIDCGRKSRRGGIGRPLWDRMLNIGYAKDGLLGPVRDQMRRAQEEIGFTWFRCHGLLDQDMYVYREEADGRPVFSFTYIDMLFDYVTDLGLKPYVELGFMPPQIAIRQTRIFDRPSVISGCADLEKWKLLIRALLEHLAERYGEETLRTWRFTTISLSYVRIGCLLREEYEDLYETTYRTVKEFDPDLQFGGAGYFPDLIENTEIGVAWFLQFASDRGCLPDFHSMQYYPCIQTDDALFMEYTLNQSAAPALLSRDPDYLRDRLDALEDLLRSYNAADRQIFLEECNSTLWQRDLSGDTCYKAVWLAKNTAISGGRAVFGYWLLTDLIEERAGIQSVFHGGYGLMTYNGIPKAGYQALRMLSRMGQTPVDSGEGWFLSETEEGTFTLLVYNYSHYSDLNCYRYKQLDRPEEAYSVFRPGEQMKMHFHLSDLPAGTYRVTRCSLSREHGSSFDQWLRLRAPACPVRRETEYLLQNVNPLFRMEVTKKSEGEILALDVTLQPLEMELVWVEKV